MNVTRLLHDSGQSLWLDNITRDLIHSGSLKHYIDDFSVTGLTSNPSIFDQAISLSPAYDEGFRRAVRPGRPPEEVLFELALEDLREAADLFFPTYQSTQGRDGWVSLEVSPALAHDSASTVKQARALHQQADRPNLFIKIPGTPEGVAAIEEAIFGGIPVNVTLLFSVSQYEAAAQAWLRGLERRLAAGLDLAVESVASLFVSRWDKAVEAHVPADLRNRLGIAVAQQVYARYRALLGSARWERLEGAGAHPQRLLWASTATKDPAASDVLYVEALVAPDTINTMPEGTLNAFASHGELRGLMPIDGVEAATTLERMVAAGVDVSRLAATLQDEGARAFSASWDHLVAAVKARSAAALQSTGAHG